MEVHYCEMLVIETITAVYMKKMDRSGIADVMNLEIKVAQLHLHGEDYHMICS